MEPSTLLARTQVAALDGIRPLIELLASEDAKVLTGAGSALFNLCLDSGLPRCGSSGRCRSCSR